MKKLTCLALFLVCGCGTNRAAAGDVYLPVEARVAALESKVASIEDRLSKLERPAPVAMAPAFAAAAPATTRQTVMTSVCENGVCRLVPVEVDVPAVTTGNWTTQAPTAGSVYGNPVYANSGPMSAGDGGNSRWFLGKNLGRTRGVRGASGGCAGGSCN